MCRPPLLDDAGRDLIGRELWQLLRSQKIGQWCREGDRQPLTPCWCSEGACLVGFHLSEAQELRAELESLRSGVEAA